MDCISRRRLTAILTVLCLGVAPAALQAAEPDRDVLADRVTKLSRGTQWKPVSAVPVNFLTHHPQGMVKIGDTLFVSSVEIQQPTKRFPQPVDGYDRDTGAGVGHLFKIDMKGNLIADITLGEGTIYHPGGIDYDGKYIWVPVAEYRPNSRSIVYRVDPETMKAEEMFRFADHVGGVVHNTDDKTLHGVSWGSRRFYRWSLDDSGKPTNANESPEKLRTLNTSHYLDYQDCKYAGKSRMLCSGVTEMRLTPEAAPFRLGGLDLVNLADGRPIFQTPVLLWTAAGMDMTHNPVWMEASDTGIRGYFMPEDDKSTLYIYETEVK
ncbi:hypothetical protein KHP60_10610 [Microvirga sp. 3-52]|uniref:DUF6454 family protein n=1 Tax=Microvirga sp. 3-52 TaxID=2792425 RepID=UPI001AD21CE3|nr:DUF6454 family protein [Microvirga sp. 3-52]MBO1904971.1 hypothetical protein [Microvirga sp. 3-52]MBS7452784.1 hypothetical protein [Microvirga sp. 3-52]